MKKVYLLIASVIAAFALQAQTNVDDAWFSGNKTMTSGNTYILTERCFVESGDTLIIEPGVVVKGNPGTGTNATALIVARGGYIHAAGTATQPIIFTAASDDISNPVDIAPGTKGLWGGLIILGKASLNSTPGETEIEGLPSGDPRSLYGGSEDTDNSGVLQYISIRYGGTSIAPNNDINGLTLGGVGSGTTIDHIEVIYNFDDGIEFFGGTVNCKYMLMAFCGDDSYDYDEGFRGKGQFWVTIQADSVGDRLGEHDGGTDPETAQPYATPTIFNATYIGKGTGSNRVMTLRDNAGGHYHNSIFIDQGRGIDIEILGNGADSYDRWQAGELSFECNLFWNIENNVAANMFKITADKYRCNSAANPAQCLADSTAEVDAAKVAWAAYFATANNLNQDPEFNSLNSNSRIFAQNALDPRPSITGPAYTSTICDNNDPWFTPVNYKGAFSAHGDFWLRGWTLMDQLGYFPTTTANTPDLSSNFTLAPNPANDIVAVSATGVQGAKATLNVLDLNGRTVLSQEAVISGDKLNAELNIKSLTNGVYFVQAIVDGAAVATKKVVKQ
ncbi:MAG: T9SS type A sorting domain-containing protein [Bacteroidia bacterium]